MTVMVQNLWINFLDFKWIKALILVSRKPIP